jgi:hypothetical protein
MKLPAKIFVKWDTFGNDEPYLEAKTTKSDLAEKDETVRVGEYRLVRSSNLHLKPVETDPENH